MINAIDKTDLLHKLLSDWQKTDRTVSLIKDKETIEYVTAFTLREYTETLLWELFQIYGREEIEQAIVKVDALYQSPYIEQVIN